MSRACPTSYHSLAPFLEPVCIHVE
jgi:hypothetical protein